MKKRNEVTESSENRGWRGLEGMEARLKALDSEQ